MQHCPYCNKGLSCQSALTRHIKSTRACIKIQQEREQQEQKQKQQQLEQKIQQLEQKIQQLEPTQAVQPPTKDESLRCECCNKLFATKYTLRNHRNVCKLQFRQVQESLTINTELTKNDITNKLEKLEETRKNDLEELKALINNITVPNAQPSVVQNMEPVTVAHIQAMALEHLDISDIEEGIDGIVDFTVTYPLYGRVICTDKARRKFRYTDESGNVINDFGGLQLSKTVFTGIQARCVQLIDQRYAELANDIKIAVDANRGYEDAVLANMVTSTELQNLKQSLIDAAKGVENDLQKGYIRKLVKELK